MLPLLLMGISILILKLCLLSSIPTFLFSTIPVDLKVFYNKKSNVDYLNTFHTFLSYFHQAWRRATKFENQKWSHGNSLTKIQQTDEKKTICPQPPTLHFYTWETACGNSSHAIPYPQPGNSTDHLSLFHKKNQVSLGNAEYIFPLGMPPVYFSIF